MTNDNEVIQVKNVDVIYKTAESLSVKKALQMMLHNEEVSFLSKYKALSNISFTMERGKVYGVIGNNGAGKSTLLRVLSGVMSPNAGIVEKNYKTINLLALGVGFSKELTGHDNIYLNGMLLGFSKNQIREVIQKIIDYSEIGEFINKPMKTYSSGMVSRLGFSIAIHMKPEVLLIDEILSVGDVNFRKKSFESLQKIIRDEKITVMLVSHNMEQIQSLCDYIIWLDKGRIVTQGEKTDVLNLYHQYYEGKLSIEEICRDSIDSIITDETEMKINCADYLVRLTCKEQMKFLEKTYDNIQEIVVKHTKVKVTRRTLPNEDIFLYFEFEQPSKLDVKIEFDEIIANYNFDSYYKKPRYDKRYGKNKVTGFHSYLDLQKGSAVISKLYYYEKLEKFEDKDSHSELYKLKKESNQILQKENQLEFKTESGYERLSFFLLLSKQKLFREYKNLEQYMHYYYDNLANNNVWCSYFMLPSGTYTKLPYSIEPFTRDGYGFSLHHSSKRELLMFYRQTKERFYTDMLDNVMLQNYMYQKNINGVFYTSYTSTWLKKDTGLVAPYIDTRLNETFIHMMHDYMPYSPFQGMIDPLKKYVDFLIQYYEEGKQVYQKEDGVFYPDYFKECLTTITHASLNHQLGCISLFRDAFVQYKEKKYVLMFQKLLCFIESTFESWVNPKSGDLFYGIRYNKHGNLDFYGKDYVYVTLIDLMQTQLSIIEMNRKRSSAVDYLIFSKINFLKKTEFDPFSDQSIPAPGETFHSKDKIRSLYEKLSDKDKII